MSSTSSPYKSRFLDPVDKSSSGVLEVASLPVKPQWADLASYRGGAPFGGVSMLVLPAKALDCILGDPSLNLRNHLSLACVSRVLRACYYTPLPTSSSSSSSSYADPSSPLWRALLALRPPPTSPQAGTSGAPTPRAPRGRRGSLGGFKARA